MSHLLDDDDDLKQRRDRELTLSTGAILSIFFGLVLICGLFFAFGYNLGQKSKAQTPTATDDTTSPAVLPGQNKPSAGSLLSSPAPETLSTPASTTASTPASAPASAPPANQPSPTAQTATAQTSSTPAPRTIQPPAYVPPPQPAPAPFPVSAPSSPSSSMPGTYIVQIAALSHPGDAAMLVSALRGKGYAVSAVNGTQDHLIHVQVGPFNNKAQASAMRDRLLADGFNAMVK